jgi:hypothetical protein
MITNGAYHFFDYLGQRKRTCEHNSSQLEQNDAELRDNEGDPDGRI